jgi:hypothetical protein
MLLALDLSIDTAVLGPFDVFGRAGHEDPKAPGSRLFAGWDGLPSVAVALPC